MLNQRAQSTYDRIMKDPKRRAKFGEKYARFLLSEIILALMKQEKVSVRALARKAGTSSALIQDIRSGKRSNITLKNLLGITSCLGAAVRIEKDDKSFLLAP
jgi:transcriptional regulator with XRE-family HTH domain